jgi:preprotein translocase subunit SecD
LAKRNTYLLIFILVLFGFCLWSIVPLDRTVFGRQGLTLGIDLNGGYDLLYSVNLSEKDPALTDAQALASVKLTIERRVNAFGITEPTVQTIQNGLGSFIEVQLPHERGGNITLAEAENLIGQVAQLDFREQVVNATGNTTWVIAEAAGSNGTEEELTGKYLKPNATVQTDPQTYQPEVAFEWDSEGAVLFQNITSRNIGKPLGIFLDNERISAPTVQAVIGAKGVITGLSLEQAKVLAIQLNSGALVAPLTIVDSSNIGPTLVADSIKKSLLAAEIGIAAVVLFMLVYYRLPGFIACLALGIYGVVILAIFKLIPVTLTMPGIAGFIVSFGMAVDANVLIFERMKEELRGGRSLAAAIEAGFNRAWTAIRDSNLTTFIACAVLYWMGGSLGALMVRGFAITLFIGVAMSMFSAITITRTFLRFIPKSRLTTNPAAYGVKL